MRKNILQALGILFLSSATLLAGSTERWIHVRVESNRAVNSNVSFNFPIEMASSVFPTIPNDDQHHGKFNFQASVNGTDLRALLEAVRNSPDNVFVTINRRGKQVSVAKAGRNMLIKIDEPPSPENHLGKTVAIKVPMPVVRAMLVHNSDQLDIGAGIRALAREGDIDVTLNGDKDTVHVWTDTRNTED